jgi:hypothetical protein
MTDPLVRLEVSKEGIEGPLGLLAIYAFGSLIQHQGQLARSDSDLDRLPEHRRARVPSPATAHHGPYHR